MGWHNRQHPAMVMISAGWFKN